MLADSISAQSNDLKKKVALEQALRALRIGSIASAEQIFRTLLRENPTDADILDQLAAVVKGGGRLDEASILLRRSVAAAPTSRRRLALVQHLVVVAGANQALAEIETWPAKERNSLLVTNLEASLHGQLGDHDREILLYERLAKAFPRNPSVWRNLANALKTVGETEKAIVAIRRAIEINPLFGEAYWALANFKSYRFRPSEIAAMRKALRDKKVTSLDSMRFHFSLGQAYERGGDYRRSFEHYAAGNRIRASDILTGEAEFTTFVDKCIEVYTQSFLVARQRRGCQASDPIFIVGLHRSGSTLIEQILASHPAVEGTSELPIVLQLWRRIARQKPGLAEGGCASVVSLTDDEVLALGQEYLDRARAYRKSDRPMFIDKHPYNWMHVGLIRLILPNARIIDARRNPMACGFSNFKQLYTDGVHYAFNQDTIGTYYQDYLRCMKHFDDVQPGKILHVLNERIIEDPEREVRRMLDHLDLPFDQACMEFHRNPRAVLTPSAEQVRRPINRDGVDHWKHYEPWLEPMKRAMGNAIDEWKRL